MQAKITALLDGLIMYDYVLFGGVFLLFIIFVILGIVLRKKTALAIFLILLSFSILGLGPTLGYAKMHQYLFKNSTTLTSQKKLQFTKAVVVRGSILNESKFDFESCKITAKAHKVSENALKNYIFKFKTIQDMTVSLSDIKKGEKIDFKIIIEPFNYSKDYNISLEADCK